MIHSGPKSYYDDYLRKQGTGRTLADPPSLLTDRGAYVNFLEVQLERVSAACLGVQSYDQRFNDMQGLIVSLEQRCGQTTRLLALSQQCIEEIRSEADSKLATITRETKEDYRDMQKSFEAMSCRIGIAERAISSMAGLQPQIEILEKRITNDANNVNVEMKKNEERNQIFQERLQVISQSITDLTLKVEKTNTAASKLTLNVDEIERKSNNVLSATELRLRNEIILDREEMKKKLQSVQVRITSEAERLQNEINKSTLNSNTTSRNQLEDILERMENTKKSLFEELDRKCTRIQANSAEDSSALNQKFKNQFASLDSVVDQINQNKFMVPSSGAATPVNEGIFNLKNQQQIISQDIEILQKALYTIESKTKNAEMHREEKDIEVQKALHNLMSRIEKLSPKFQNPKIDEKYYENYGNKELHHDQSGIQESQSDSRTQFEINVLSDQDKVKSKNSTWSQDSSTSRKIDPKINLNAILTDKNLSKEDLMEIIASAVGKGSTSTSSSNRGDEMRDVSDSETESRISERRKKSLADDESNIQYTKLNDTIGRDNKKSDYSSTGEFQSLQPKRSVEEGFIDKSVSGFNRSDKSELVMTDNYNNDGDDYDHRSYQTDDSKFRNKFASNPLNDRERERREISSGSDPYSRPMSRSLEGSLDSSKLRDRASNDTKFSNVSKSLENEKYAFDDNPRNVEKSKKSESLDQYRANEEETEVRNRRGIQERENWYSPESDREKAMSSNSPQRESVGHRVVFRNSSKESSKESSGQLAEYDRLTSTDKDRYLKETDNDNDNDREHVNRGRYDRDDVKESERRSRDIPSSRGSKSTSSSASMPSRNNPYSANLSGSTSVSPRTSPIRTKLSSGIVGKSSGILKREDRALSPSESDRTASLRAGRTRSSIQTSNSPIRYASNRTPDSTYSVRSTSTSGGTRLAEDPIREVLSRFLDIYQNDQNQIKSTLEKLALPGDQKFKMNSSAAQTNVIKNDQGSDFEVRKQELFDDDRDSISTRNHAKDKDDNNKLRNRRSLAENDVEVKNAMYVGQHNSNRRSSPTQEAENLSRANELFSRYGEGEIYNYNDHNKENRNNDNDGTNNNYHDNHVDYNDDVRKKINDNYNDKKIFNDNSNDNDREKIINHSYRNENNNDNDHNVSNQADFHDRRSNVESNYRNIMNDVGNCSSKSRVGYERNRVSDGEEEEEYQNYDNNDSTNSRLRQKKRKSLSQFRQKKPQLSLSPKRDSRSSVSSIKRSSSTGRRTSDVTDEKHSYLKSANNGCSSSLKKPNVSHWLPNKSVSPVRHRTGGTRQRSSTDAQEPQRTFVLTTKTARNSDEIQKPTNKDSSTNTGYSDKRKNGKSSSDNYRENKGDRKDENDLNLSVASRTSRDDRVFSSYNGRGSDDECSVFTSTTLTSVGQEKRAASLSQNPRVGSSKINTNRRVNTLVGSTARIK